MELTTFDLVGLSKNSLKKLGVRVLRVEGAGAPSLWLSGMLGEGKEFRVISPSVSSEASSIFTNHVVCIPGHCLICTS